MGKLSIRRGFTLVELMIVIVIVGILAALAVVGISKYTGKAKSAEAISQMRYILDAAEGKALAGASQAGAILADGAAAATPDQSLCASTTATVPAAVPANGEKVQSVAADWEGNGWGCLGFRIESPQYFAYGWTNAAPDYFAAATSNFDGDATDMEQRFGGQWDAATRRFKRWPAVIIQTED